MSYLVLARKWRPKSFADVVGQSHIVRALENALSTGRVHHAFLFAGTRGVGKTTLARILAKALNCEEGVSAEPCGHCPVCVSVDEGRFLDLIEVDAASRTGVDDMRELLENVQYTPSSGRFKVYLVDEVHMLSRQSFNALLKTLEEPPPHVKFLFATTDPQKLPVTVLSRCLQFNLKRLSTKQIVDRMIQICSSENLDADPAALKRIAIAASGSMRDALSLLDQALAYGGDRLIDDDVAAMLGSMDRHRILDLLQALATTDGSVLLEQIRLLDELVPDYEIVLDELATTLQRIAIIQLAGSATLDEEDDVAAMEALAGQIGPERVQLYYQIAVTGRRDLGLAPDPRIGFEMTLLRMLAFQPAEDGQAPENSVGGPKSADQRNAGVARPPVSRSAEKTSGASETERTDPAKMGRGSDPASPEDLNDWPAFVAGLGLDGAARQLADNSSMESGSPFELHLRIQRSNEHLLTDNLKRRLSVAVQEKMGSGVKVRFQVSDTSGETAAARIAEQAERKLDQAKDVIEQDPKVRDLVDVFGGEVVPDSVRPVSSNSNGNQK
jgi:DNA polymerase-3 subunit gamma/tau